MGNPFADIAARSLASADGRSESRRQKMLAVFAACRRLGLDEDTRRDIQQDVIGKASMSKMDLTEIGRLLDHLNRDWKGPSGHRAHVGKVRALWWSLYWLGTIDQPKERAIDAFVQRQAGVAALRFLDHRSAPAVIEALKSWCAREGVRWPSPPEELGDRQAVLDAIWLKLREAALVSDRAPVTYVTASLEIPRPDQRAWTRHELDAAIRLVGKRLRRGLNKRSVE